MNIWMLCCGLILGGAAVVPATQAGADQRAAYGTVLDQHKQSIVTVSYSVSMDFMGSQQRAQGEVEGVILADGLILVPSNILNPSDQLKELMSGQADSIPTIKSSEFNVRLPGSDEPLQAEVLTQDRDFGLAWLRLKGKGRRVDLPSVDLKRGRDPQVGELAFVLNLVSELYGYAPYVAEVQVQGRIRVPYEAFVTNAFGKMLFDRKGRPLGYAVQRVSGNPNLMGSGGLKVFGVLIPSSRLAELTQRALRTEARVADGATGTGEEAGG